MVYVSSTKHNSEFKEIIIKTMRDLLNMPWLDAIEMVVRNFLWPFRKMGIFGLVFGVIYWPVVMPVSIVACLCYCIPLLFVSLRLVTRALKLSSQDDTHKGQILAGEDCHWLSVVMALCVFTYCKIGVVGPVMNHDSSYLMSFRWNKTRKCHETLQLRWHLQITNSARWGLPLTCCSHGSIFSLCFSHIVK